MFLAFFCICSLASLAISLAQPPGSDPPIFSRECRYISYYLLRVVDFLHFTANVCPRKWTVEGLYNAVMEERLIYVRLGVLRSLMLTSEQSSC